LIAASIRTVSILVQPANKPVVLTQDPTLVGLLENSPALAEDLAKDGTSVAGEITVVLRSSQQFAEHRVLHECIAFKTPENVG